jgi:hypothetical protein
MGSSRSMSDTKLVLVGVDLHIGVQCSIDPLSEEKSRKTQRWGL